MLLASSSISDPRPDETAGAIPQTIRRDDSGDGGPMTQAIRITLAGARDRHRWNQFVEANPNASIAHVFEWKSIIETAYRKSCYYLCSESDNGLCGVLPLVFMPGPLGGSRLVSMPYLDRGGPLSTSDEVTRKLTQTAFSILDDRSGRSLELRSESRSTRDAEGQTDRFRLILTLPSTDEEAWNAVGPKVRNQIRKSEKAGLTTRRVSGEQLGSFYEIHSKNMHQLGSPGHSLLFFKTILDQLESRVSPYLTFNRSEVAVAGGIALRFQNQIVVPWASSRFEARRYCPNHSLYWQIIRDAIAQRASSFDFGRSSIGAGTFHFKKQWGADPVPLRWTFLGRSGAALPDANLNPRSHAWVARMWRKLPWALARRLGPAIRGHLPN